MNYSFRFQSDELNHDLIDLIKNTEVPHSIDDQEVIHYAACDDESLEDLICQIRDQLFDAWRLLMCPADCVKLYRKYMKKNQVPFHEEITESYRIYFT